MAKKSRAPSRAFDWQGDAGIQNAMAMVAFVSKDDVRGWPEACCGESGMESPGPIAKSPADIKDAYRNASFSGNNRVVFDIKGNDYRLVVAVRYSQGLMFVRFIGTHRRYDRIDVETI